MDLSILQDFQINTNADWSTWQFTNQEYKDFPLSFFNKFGKSIKCCDLSTIAPNKDDADFVVVQGNTKTKNKQYISRNITMGDKKKTGQSWSKIFTKKQKKNYRAYTNQFKTKFRQITVKNDWILLKAINKRNLDEAPPVKDINVEVLKEVGKLRYLNAKVQKINWNPTGFKQNEAYHVDSISTMNDTYLAEEIGANLFEQQQSQRRLSVVCSLQFLLAIMTARGGQYPWTISVSKAEHVLVLDRYSTTQDANFSYLDLFTPNQNTSGNMARDEAKVRQNCINGTKMTKIFQDLLASGDLQQTEQQQESQQKQVQNQEQELEQIKKYIKISVDNIDVYTSVKINGLKKKSNGDQQPCLIRTFVETGTDGGWIQDIKKSQGTLVFQQYLANSCSLQKWICQANLAGVDLIKFGFIGFLKQKPLIVNVEQTTIKNLEKFISFKYSDCYSILKYIVNEMSSYEDGQYVLSRNAYSPLSLKLYKLPTKQQEEEQN